MRFVAYSPIRIQKTSILRRRSGTKSQSIKNSELQIPIRLHPPQRFREQGATPNQIEFFKGAFGCGNSVSNSSIEIGGFFISARFKRFRTKFRKLVFRKSRNVPGFDLLFATIPL